MQRTNKAKYKKAKNKIANNKKTKVQKKQKFNYQKMIQHWTSKNQSTL